MNRLNTNLLENYIITLYEELYVMFSFKMRSIITDQKSLLVLNDCLNIQSSIFFFQWFNHSPLRDRIAIISNLFSACVSSKNNTTIYVCVGEDVTLSCPQAGINKTVSWFRRNVSKTTIKMIYLGSRRKDRLPPNIEVDVNEDKGENNLTIHYLTKADTGTYQCLHDKSLISWLFNIVIKGKTKKNWSIVLLYFY